MKKELWLDRTVTWFSWFSGFIILAGVGCLTGFLLLKGYASLSLDLIFGETDPVQALVFEKQVFDGLFPALIGTLFLVLLSVTIAVPVGLGTGIYMAEYAGGRIKDLLSLFFDILAGIPSIVVGLFGFSVIVFLHHYFGGKIYPCLLASSLSLAFLVLPYIIRTTQVALESVPHDIRRIAPALGGSHLQNIVHVLVPRSFSAILSGIILAIGRSAEDTAVIMLTGVVATAGVPHSLFGQYEALPFYIYYISSQYTDQQELMKGYGAAIILLVICFFLFGMATFIQSKLTGRLQI